MSFSLFYSCVILLLVWTICVFFSYSLISIFVSKCVVLFLFSSLSVLFLMKFLVFFVLYVYKIKLKID